MAESKLYYCETCGRTMDGEQFYTSRNLEKYPNDGKLRQCKKCITMYVDNWDPETFKPILKEIDVPYIKEVWDNLLVRYGKDPSKLTGMTVLGRYLSTMRTRQHINQRWADTEGIAEKTKAKKIESMQKQGYTDDEIETQLSIDHGPTRPEGLGTSSIDSEPQEEPDDLMDELTEEDKLYLRLKWGRGYRADEWVKMEQLYQDMMKSYDIQTAGHKDTLIMICKASLKTNQLLDINDIEGAQKTAKMYDALMKSGRFTAAQNKEENGDAIDSIGELVAMCEKDKFIPKFYTDGPQDKVDRVIQDMQSYTRNLVKNELGLGNLFENSLKAIEKEREQIQAAAEMGEDFEAQQEEELFKDTDGILTDKDVAEFLESLDEDNES